MNNSINYSGFVEMFLDSSDDFEPYGYAELSDNAGNAPVMRSTGHNQYHVDDVEE